MFATFIVQDICNTNFQHWVELSAQQRKERVDGELLSVCGDTKPRPSASWRGQPHSVELSWLIMIPVLFKSVKNNLYYFH